MNKENKFVVPMATMKENPEGYDLLFVIPGVGKGDAELHIENRTLTLKTHSAHENPAGFRLAVHEFDTPDYAISVELPERVDLATLKGNLENGILKVEMKKLPETQARKIEIA